MRYVVISPKNKMICFDHAGQVAEYCMEKDNDYLDHFCADQALEYENMTPVEIGYAYATVGAQSGGCRVFQTTEVLDVMKDEMAEEELIEEVNLLFNNRRLNHEIDCPSYLEDVLSLMTPIPVASLSGNVYSGDNIDGASSERTNPGV
ncbi:MAG: hypothetical protein ACRCTE_03130 [Cellulosilyticaceae bacterium]